MSPFQGACTSHLSPLTSHVRSSHGRHIELIGRWVPFRGFRRAVIPALHDALVAGIKADAFFAVSVIIAEERAFPAAKGMPRHRHRNRHVNSDHPDLYAMGELLRGFAVIGIAGHTIPKLVRIDQINRTFEIRDPDNTEDWSKDFFAINRH